MQRHKFTWNVTMQREDGSIDETKFSAFWDPEQEGCTEAVMSAARAQRFIKENKRFDYQPISAALVN